MARLMAALLGALPRRWLIRLSAALAWLLFSLLRVRRGVTLTNISQAFNITKTNAIPLARAVYRHLVLGALEFWLLPRLTPEEAGRLLPESQRARLLAPLSQGRGLLVLSGHLGQWDLLTCAAGLCGLRVHVITRRIKNRWLDRLWMQTRQRCGVELLPDQGSARQVLAALRRNEIVVVVLDQHQPQGEPIPFFGRLAATSTTLARLARATRAPVIPAFLLRRGQDFELVIGEVLPRVRSDRAHDDVREMTLTYTRELEHQIRRHPEQWLWLHRRWKLTAQPGPEPR